MTEKEQQIMLERMQGIIKELSPEQVKQLLRYANKLAAAEHNETETKPVTFREAGQPYCPECGYYLKADIPPGCVYEFPHCPECGVSLSWNSSERARA